MTHPHPVCARLQVVPPSDPRMVHIIDTMAAFVAQDGCAFEQEVMRRERDSKARTGTRPTRQLCGVRVVHLSS